MKKNTFYQKFIFGLTLLFPFQSYAQILQGTGGLRASVVEFTRIATEAVVPLLFAAALAYFIWGIANFIRTADNPEARKKGKSQIIWGIIALFIMVGYFSLTSVFTTSFFGESAGLPQLFED